MKILSAVSGAHHMLHNTLPGFSGYKKHPLAKAMALLGASVLLPSNGALMAQEETEGLRLPTILVVGNNPADVSRQPGAVSLVQLEELILRQPRSTEEALRNVPGITIKPEEESALSPTSACVD
jgi:Fe(3+) dicitrate transport protein